MECLDCGAVNDAPAASSILFEEIFADEIDVDMGAREYVQLECQDCGAILGYTGAAAAFGGSDVRGYY